MSDTFDILRKLVDEVKYKPGWYFRIVDEDGALRLVITDTKCIDAYNPGTPMPLSHYHPVPSQHTTRRRGSDGFTNSVVESRITRSVSGYGGEKNVHSLRFTDREKTLTRFMSIATMLIAGRRKMARCVIN